jgi:1,2-diacylglycerol 3-beta-glucosyltransferase
MVNVEVSKGRCLLPKSVVFARLMQYGFNLLAGIGGSYFATLTAATFLPHKRVPKPDAVKPRFAVVVPAHNEEYTIAATLESLERIDYPAGDFGVFVVADNCEDATAEVARRYRCTVWERRAPEHRAKGYALSWAFERIPKEYDAVVVIDADTRMHPGSLAGFARAYQSSTALQAFNFQAARSDPSSVASYVASTLGYLKPLGRDNLGFSAGLGGNGMCIPLGLLEEVPWRRFGLAEDAEYHVDLVLAGRKVRFVPEARVQATAPGTLRALRSQRLRWERGRVSGLRRLVVPLLARSLHQRDAVSLEALVSIVAPPVSLTVSTSVGGIALGLMRGSTVSLVVGTLGLTSTACAILRALWMVQAPVRIYAYSLVFPLFVAWKTYLSVRSLLRGDSQDWVRTERSEEFGATNDRRRRADGVGNAQVATRRG